MLNINEFYDQTTGSFCYLLYCQDSKYCAIIDPVATISDPSTTLTFSQTDIVIDKIKEHELQLLWLLETHIHADHATGCDYIKKRAVSEGFGKNVQSAIGADVTKVTQYWANHFEFTDPKLQTASHFDKLLKNGEKIKLGDHEIEVMSTPGHTPCCVCYKINDNIFVGDVLFMPDIGSARCDFPGGSAEESYDSVQKIFKLPDNTKLYTGHDYPKNRDLQFLSNVKQQKEENIMIGGNITKKDFVAKRNAKDANLAPPKLLLQSLKVNIFAGKFYQ